MIVAVVAVLGALLVLLYLRRSQATAELVRDSSPALDRFLREALEHELADRVLGHQHSTERERGKLRGTLGDEPDADVVAKIEELVRSVDLEFVRYAHESDVGTSVNVRYEDGHVGTATKRFALADVPASVREDLEKKGATRVFRTWAFPWQRVRAL